MPNPHGRPPKLNHVVRTEPVFDLSVKPPRQTGTRNVTLIDSIIEDLRVGLPAHRAAQRAGIPSDTFYAWEKYAARARTRQIAGDRITRTDEAYIEFSDRVRAAEIEWELAATIQLERIGRGDIPTSTTVTKYDGQGNVLEVVERKGATLPDAKTLLSRLRLRFPDIYRERIDVGGVGEDGAIPVDVRAAALGEALAQFQQAQGQVAAPEPQEPPSVRRSRRKPKTGP